MELWSITAVGTLNLVGIIIFISLIKKEKSNNA